MSDLQSMQVPVVGNVRSRVNLYDHSSFLEKLIQRMGSSVEASGGLEAAAVRQKIIDSANFDARALEARFELGKSDQHYLMASILPLHTTQLGDGTGSRLYTKGLYPELELSGKLGVVQALRSELDVQYDAQVRHIKSMAGFLEWIFEMEEIRDFVVAHLQNPDCPKRQGADEAVRFARELAVPEGMVRELKAKEKNNELGAAVNALCLLMETLLLIYTVPMDEATQQYENAVFNGTEELHAALQRLAQKVNATDAIDATDSNVLNAVNADLALTQDAQATATGVNFGPSATEEAELMAGQGLMVIPSIDTDKIGEYLFDFTKQGGAFLALFLFNYYAPGLTQGVFSTLNVAREVSNKMSNAVTAVSNKMSNAVTAVSNTMSNAVTTVSNTMSNAYQPQLRSDVVLRDTDSKIFEAVFKGEMSHEQAKSWFETERGLTEAEFQNVWQQFLLYNPNRVNELMKYRPLSVSQLGELVLHIHETVQTFPFAQFEGKNPAQCDAELISYLLRRGGDAGHSTVTTAFAFSLYGQHITKFLASPDADATEKLTGLKKKDFEEASRRAQNARNSGTDWVTLTSLGLGVAVMGLVLYQKFYQIRGRSNSENVTGSVPSNVSKAEPATKPNTASESPPNESPGGASNAGQPDANANANSDDNGAGVLEQQSSRPGSQSQKEENPHCEVPPIVDREQIDESLKVAKKIMLDETQTDCKEDLDSLEIRRGKGLSPLWDDNLRVPKEASAISELEVRFAIARGLCGKRGPLQLHPQNITEATSLSEAFLKGKNSQYAPSRLVYSMPKKAYSGPATALGMEHSKTREDIMKRVRKMGEGLFPKPPSGIKLNPGGVHDFVLIDEEGADLQDTVHPKNETVGIDDAHIAQWLPAKSTSFKGDSGVMEQKPEILPQDQFARFASRAAICEHQIDYLAKLAAESDMTESPRAREMALAMRAAVKLRQLQSLHNLAVESTKSDRLEADLLYAPYLNNNKTVFVTRPCMRCPDGRVLYPIDAGLASITLPDADYLNSIREAKGSQKFVYLRLNARKDWRGTDLREWFKKMNLGPFKLDELGIGGAGTTRQRPYVTVGVRSGLGLLTSKQDNSKRFAPLYAASLVENTALVSSDTNPNKFCRSFPKANNLPSDRDFFSVESTRNLLLDGMGMCEHLKALECEREYLEKKERELKTDPNSGGPDYEDGMARARRGVIYNDALREAAIGGDRLWSFAQQLSGTIAESVESVCVIDETTLQRQQKAMRDERRTLATRVADSHLQIVRSVFSAALREAGIRIGIDDEKGGFTVLNTTLQKQAQDLMTRSDGGGFFAKGVDLQNLLSTGRGSITFDELFAQLKEVGRALQDSAESLLPQDTTGTQLSLEFLRAPRNSLFIQWKDETRAAIRRAFDLFSIEMRQYHNHRMRHISAYELIEGNNSSLCNSFAEFAGMYMAMTRMQNPSQIAYISQASSTLAARKVKLALQRLVNAACEYVTRTAPPGHSRTAYFRDLAPVYVPPPIVGVPIDKSGWQMMRS